MFCVAHEKEGFKFADEIFIYGSNRRYCCLWRGGFWSKLAVPFYITVVMEPFGL